MNDRLAGLRSSLEERDRLRGFSSRLESLKSDGSLSAAEYATGKADYDSRITAVTSRITTLKAAFRKELEASEREAEMCQLRLEGAETRHLAGELTVAQLEEEKARWSGQAQRIDEQRSALGAALAADSMEDLGDTTIVAPAVHPAVPSAPTAVTRPNARRAPSVVSPPFAGNAWTPLRIAALATGVILVISVRLAWLAPTELLGSNLAVEAGVSVTFIAGLAGIVCGLIAVGASFIRTPHTRGIAQLIVGCLALASLVAAVLLGELPLLDSYFRELVVLREGLFAYLAAAAGLAVLGIMQMRRRG